MINVNTASILALSLFLGSGISLKKELKLVSPTEVATPMSTAGTVIDDFSTPPYSWWTGSDEKFKYEIDDNQELKVTITNSGQVTGPGTGYDCFGKQFDPVDFTKTPVLKLKMRYTGPSAPKVRIDVKDSEGNVSNAKAIVKKVEATDKFVEYYYDYTGRWTQSYPGPANLDPVEIVELLIFVNPGGPQGWTGTLYLDDVQAVTVAECPKQ